MRRPQVAIPRRAAHMDTFWVASDKRQAALRLAARVFKGFAFIFRRRLVKKTSGGSKSSSGILFEHSKGVLESSSGGGGGLAIVYSGSRWTAGILEIIGGAVSAKSGLSRATITAAARISTSSA